MHRQRGLNGVGLAAVDLEAAIRDRALDELTRRLDGKRLQEEDTAQTCRCRRTRHLEVARAREDDAALHDVVGDEGVKRTGGGRAQDDAAVRRGQAALRKWVWLVAPRALRDATYLLL